MVLYHVRKNPNGRVITQFGSTEASDAVGYKAPGSVPGMHETLIPFKQLANKFFFDACIGEKANERRET